GQDIRTVSEQSDRQRAFLVSCGRNEVPCFIETVGRRVEVACCDTPLNAGGIDLNGEKRGTIHRCRQRLRATHSTESACEQNFSLERASEMFTRCCRERFVGSLHDSLSSDVDPASGGHLPVHR